MNRKTMAVVVFVAGIFCVVILMHAATSANAQLAGVEPIKLPYAKGESFIVVQGYNSPPTHIKKDEYAMDLSQDGCDAYGKAAVAASAGTVMLAQDNGYDGGYGTQVLIDDGGHVVTRYAHMIAGSLSVAQGQTIAQGEPLGKIGNTGLVAGAACPSHPGTHIHFAMYDEASDGSFSAHLAEPISGYTHITEGNWYISDNGVGLAEKSSAVAQPAEPEVIGSAGSNMPAPASNTDAVLNMTSSVPVANSSTVASIAAVTTVPPIPVGGVSAAPASTAVPVTPTAQVSDVTASSTGTNTSSSILTSTSTTPTPTSSPALVITKGLFDSSTLSIDLAWQAASGTSAGDTSDAGNPPVYEIFYSGAAGSSGPSLVATTTANNFSYPLATEDYGTSPQFAISLAPAVTDDADASSSLNSSDMDSTVEAVPIALPSWWDVVQPADDTNSDGSWYDDNWYDLGTGFYGTIRSLTLKGFVNSTYYFKSHLYLEEYLDPDYSRLNQGYTISDDAPFTPTLQKITISGLNIPLQPNKYYRLSTSQDFQNRSVILTGTTATGTAMWDEFIYGTGRVENYYSFYPYLAAVMIPDYPPLAPPNPPQGMSITFDPASSTIGISWQAATDPDTTSSLLTYQVNVSPSSTLIDSDWRTLGSNTFQVTAAVTFGNTYTIGVRAVDDLNNVGQPLTQTWNFPDDYTPPPVNAVL